MLRDRFTELGSGFAVAVIPARGGSKGIPRKNLRMINGETLIARCVRTCRKARLLSAVFVSTDDEEIASEAKAAGAEVIGRPSSLAGDTVPTTDVLSHAIDAAGICSMVVCLVQCTAPLTTPQDVDGTIARLLETDADCAIACVETHDFQVRPGYDGRLRGVGYELAGGLPRRQDLPPLYAIAGSVWAYNLERFVARSTMYSENCVAYPVARRLDIDTQEDLELAAILLSPATKRADSAACQYPL